MLLVYKIGFKHGTYGKFDDTNVDEKLEIILTIRCCQTGSY